jgi:hypothetical protein
MDDRDQPDLDRIRYLARLLAETDPGPAGELARELADGISALAATVGSLSARLDALWQLISAVVESAGLSAPAAGAPIPGAPIAGAPPAQFAAELESARSTGKRGIRLSIDGREWVAALSQQPPAADPESWAAIARLAQQASDPGDQDEM